jgi:hypothetical protein
VAARNPPGDEVAGLPGTRLRVLRRINPAGGVSRRQVALIAALLNYGVALPLSTTIKYHRADILTTLGTIGRHGI